MKTSYIILIIYYNILDYLLGLNSYSSQTFGFLISSSHDWSPVSRSLISINKGLVLYLFLSYHQIIAHHTISGEYQFVVFLFLLFLLSPHLTP